jgi:hypothetical protein
LEAVELSIATPWNNGSIEGHINRLKAIKRQTYGRAGFELLKARVMPWHVTQAAVLVVILMLMFHTGNPQKQRA